MFPLSAAQVIPSGSTVPMGNSAIFKSITISKSKKAAHASKDANTIFLNGWHRHYISPKDIDQISVRTLDISCRQINVKFFLHTRNMKYYFLVLFSLSTYLLKENLFFSVQPLSSKTKYTYSSIKEIFISFRSSDSDLPVSFLTPSIAHFPARNNQRSISVLTIQTVKGAVGQLSEWKRGNRIFRHTLVRKSLYKGWGFSKSGVSI